MRQINRFRASLGLCFLLGTGSIGAEPIVYEILDTVPYDREAAINEAKRSALSRITEQFSALSLIIDSNELSCVQLTIEGIDFWLVVNFTPLPVASIVPTIRVSHYNPDFVISSYPQLGASPVLESDLLYDLIQTKVARNTFELLLPDHNFGLMEEEDQYGGHFAESGGSRRHMIYSEAEVIGHPGNIFSLAGLVLSGNLGRISEAPIEILSELATIPLSTAEQGRDIIGEFVGGGNIIPTTTGDYSLWQAPGLGDVSRWKDQSAVPLEFHKTIRSLLSAINFGDDLVDSIGDLGSVAGMVSETLDDPLSAITDGILGSDTAMDAMDGVGEAVEDLSVVTLVLDIVRDPDLNPDELVELEDELALLGIDAEQIDEMISGVTEVDQDLLDTEVSSGGGAIFSFCPSDTLMFSPYYLPGINTVGWRFGLPEMIYRNSYAMPNGDTELFIGTFNDEPVEGVTDSDGETPAWLGEASLPQWSNWANIYPRTGWVNTPDELKGRAAAAFRAAHIVTRPDQSHIYIHPEKFDNGLKREDTREGLSPLDIESGAWQMVKPELADECTLLQDSGIDAELYERRDEYVVNEETGEASFTEGSLTSEDGTYVWNLWRHYECSVEPSGDVVSHLLYLDLGGIPITE